MRRAAWALVLALAVGRAAAEEPDVDLVRGPAPTVRAGQPATVSLSIVPRAGRRLLAAGPVLVRVSGEGVRPARALYRKPDAVDPRADVPRFEIALAAERPGAASLVAECTFYLCRGERCRPVTERAGWTFDVAP